MWLCLVSRGLRHDDSFRQTLAALEQRRPQKVLDDVRFAVGQRRSDMLLLIYCTEGEVHVEMVRRGLIAQLPGESRSLLYVADQRRQQLIYARVVV